MAAMLVLISLCCPLAVALPIPQSPESSIALEVDRHFRRPLFNIIWSALITIAACTYSAIHPNVPNPAATFSEVLRERLQMTLFAILGPDMMILWAVTQRKAARKIWVHFQGPQFKEKIPQWTMTHAFFLQMGGFMIRDDKGDYRVLTPSQLDELMGPNQGFMLKVSEQEIDHRSKGDKMAMVIAIGQTSWFLIQCIARFGANLNVTMLELTAFSFAILNMITWFVWLDKPHHVRLPIYLDTLGTRIPGPDFDLEVKPPEDEGRPEAGPAKDEGLPKNASSDGTESGVKELEGREIEIKEVEVNIKAEEITETPPRLNHSSEAANAEQAQSHGTTKWGFYEKEKRVISYLIHPLLYAVGLGNIKVDRKSVKYKHGGTGIVENVGTYYTAWFKVRDGPAENEGGKGNPPTIPTADSSPNSESEKSGPSGERPRTLVGIIGSTIAAVFFGAIHCVGWASLFEFPTKEERFLWTIASTSITLIPIASFFAACLHCLYRHLRHTFNWMDHFYSKERLLFKIVFYAGSLPFVAARIVLIVLAFTTLRHLPDSAYDTIRWVSMLPHI